jgi:SAM-dependent methyltransferase
MISWIKNIAKKHIPERQRIVFKHQLFKLRGLYYYGNHVNCNCCGGSFRKFLPFGKVKRLGADCPYCHSLERNRLLLFYLQRETSFFTQKLNVLHFAPEYILEKRFRKLSNLDYLSADLNPELAMSKQDITDIQFPDNSFDMIICSHVLMHVPEEEKAINELYRVLKKGGTTLLMTKIDFKRNTTYEVTGVYAAEDRLKTYGDDEIFRVHGTDFADRVRKAGFLVEEIDYAILLGKQFEKYGLGTGELIFKCSKAV